MENSPLIRRSLDLESKLKSKSCFLFGPRQTGKSHLVAHTLPQARVYDLLDSKTYQALSYNPSLIAQETLDKGRLVVIDEIQRLPGLLNEVHRLIEKEKLRFLLTGSSARKLRKGGVNLLGGRARTLNLHPLTRQELGKHFNLGRAISRGLLPSIYFSDDPQEDLKAYTGSYLQQEIVAEGAARNIPSFMRFLSIAAACNGTIVNFTNVASDAQVPRTTVHEYFGILRDTLILRELPAWKFTTKRKPLSSSKYYFFDGGVVGSLQGRGVREGTPEFGVAFETYLMHELFAHISYVSGDTLHFWKSASGFEVDFILGDHTAIEVKAKETVSGQDLRSLRALKEEGVFKRHICVSLSGRPRTLDGITVLSYTDFLDALWDGEYS